MTIPAVRFFTLLANSRARKTSGLPAAVLRLAIAIFLTLLWQAAQAAPGFVIPPKAGEAPVSLASHVEVFEDLSGAMTYEQVSALTGPTRFVHQAPTREHRSSGFWYRFRLHNPGPHAVEWWLETGCGTLSRADLFINASQGPVTRDMYFVTRGAASATYVQEVVA